ncbi:class I SAM-dependent methyltransferase [Candidatus Parcubacteria bacterium]|nr:MAG: class I SAM-dependent methyltransferase [Candidatus Parcubacteria bacterium]
MFQRLKAFFAGQRPNVQPVVHISCVVDDHPRFRMQAWNWLLSLKAVNTECRMFIHYTPTALNSSAIDNFKALGATLVEIEPFGDGASRYCNKIRQLESVEFLAADYVVLSDADLVFLEDPYYLVREGVFRAKTVDGPNPPEPLWRGLFVRSGLEDKLQTVSLEMFPGVDTFSTNFNGGLYVMPTAMAGELAQLWKKHALFCLQQTGLLGDYLHHSDQLGMGLALAESGLPVDLLPVGDNFPSHLPECKLSLLTPQPIRALHYHSHVDQHGLPRNTGIRWADEAIQRIRAILVEQRRKRFLNEIFWDFRYDQFPELGSGLGSRGDVLAFKTSLLHPYIEMIGEATILDVGCGDLEVFSALPATHYTGIDLSEQAITLARKKMPEWSFKVAKISDFADESFDYTFCIDVLIHQPDAEAARSLASDLVRVARKGVFFSVHTHDIEGNGISFNTGFIKSFVDEMPEISALHELGSYRDVTLYFAEKGLGERWTKHDIGLQEMVLGARYSERPGLLKELIAYSRSKLGFFPATVIRSHEYPWFVEQMSNCSGKKILDVGAGVSLMPLYLADHGALVTTVDNHPIIRNEQPMESWNEWGFLDYSELDARIRSFHVDMCEFEPGERFDMIYSVSVIEHMPAVVRRLVIERMAGLLQPGGLLLLSLDLIPGSNLLWNLNAGVVVDESDHGSLDDVKAELQSAGFEITSEESLLGMPMSRTDVAYFVCKYNPSQA